MRTLRIVGIISCAAGLLLSTDVAFARDQATSTTNGNNKGELRGLVATTTSEENAKNARDLMQSVRADAQTRMTAQREKMTQRMTEIKDKVKQAQAQKIAKQFENLNSTWTDHFMNLLDRYDAIVQKMQDRAAIAAEKGKDSTAATTAIQVAKTSIANARTVVTVQAAKTYTPAVTDSATPTTASGQESMMKEFRSSFQTLHSTLFNDLFALRDGPMKDARTAVQSALQSLGTIPGVDDEKSATTTEKKSNQ